MDGKAFLQRDDPGVDVGGQALRDGPTTAQIPGPIPVEQGEHLARADVDGVELGGVLVPELAGDQRFDVAAGRAVLLKAEGTRHQKMPEVGDLPEVHVRVVRQGAENPKPGTEGAITSNASAGSPP
jgi:hypothetical protein